jgi:hypothetical protein
VNLEIFKGKVSIIDTDSSYVYIGTVTGEDEDYIILENVDVHDVKDGASTKEQYILNVRKFNVQPNRKRVYILKEKVISISLLDTVILY